MSDSQKALWTGDDGSRRKMMSEAIKSVWANDDGHIYKAVQKTALTVLKSKEVKEKIREIKESTKYKEKAKMVGKAANIAYKRHPEIRAMMHEVAETFPKLKLISKKMKTGIELTEHEKAYRLTYFNECRKRMPEYPKIIGKEQQKILSEWGFFEK